MWERFRQGRIPDEQLPEAIIAAWTGAEDPYPSLRGKQWRTMFEHSGFLRDGKPADKPTDAPTLWRGALFPTQPVSWTADRDLAVWFAERNVERHGWGYLLRLDAERVPLEDLRMVNTADDPHLHRGEDEWVFVPLRKVSARLVVEEERQ